MSEAVADATQRLITAVRAGDLDECRSALAAGADVNGEARGGHPFYEVLRTDFAGDLITAFLDVEVAFEDGDRTALGVAAEAGNLAGVRQLLVRGADANELSEGHSPLSLAITAAKRSPGLGTIGALRRLVHAGARTEAEEEPPLVQAVLNRASAPVLRILLSGPGSVVERRRDGTPLLVLAAARNHVVAVTVLLAAGARDDARDADGRTALRHAAEQGFTDIVTALLAVGTEQPSGHDVDRPLRTLPRSRGNLIPYGWADDPVPPAAALATWSAQPSVTRITGSAEQMALLARVVSEACERVGDELRSVTGYDVSAFEALRDRLRHADTLVEVPAYPQAGLRVTGGVAVELSAVQIDMLHAAALNIGFGAASWRTPLVDRQVLDELMASLRRISRWS